MMTDKAKPMRMLVQGMTCDDCNRHVAHALESAGAEQARADFRRREALFMFAGENTSALAAAVKEAGYRPGRVELLEEANTRPSGRDGSAGAYDLAIIGAGSAAF